MISSKIKRHEILNNLGFKSLNEIQETLLAAAAVHPHLLLLSPTGSGKTAAYLLSILHHLEEKPGVQALILAPTRELVLQIEAVLKQMKLPVKVNICYGGHAFSIERKNLTTPPTILVGTPGRVEDHLRRETFDASGITQVVYDEFDKSLEFGFSAQMEAIAGALPNVKRQILVSATNGIEVPAYLKLKDQHTVDFSEEPKGDLAQQQLLVAKNEKPEGLLKILEGLKLGENAITFVNHREACERIKEFLEIRSISYAIFHGGLEQDKRELALTKFRNGSAQVLIATDIAARGIDIPDLDYVIHYQMPSQEDVFIHRNGRTARMKASGTSIILRVDGHTLPDYITEEPETFEPHPLREMARPEWVTLYVGKGKKDKVNKFDLVGFFLQFDFMEKADLGLIEVKDFSAYVAVRRTKSHELLKTARDKRVKGKKIKIDLAR